MDRHLERQKGTGGRRGQVLEPIGVVAECDIAAALVRQFGFKTVANRSRACFSPKLLSLFDSGTAAKKSSFRGQSKGKLTSWPWLTPLIEQLSRTFCLRMACGSFRVSRHLWRFNR